MTTTPSEDPTSNDFDTPTTPTPPKRTNKAGSSSILVAALSGLSMSLGWENHREESTIAVETTNDQDWLNLEMGPLEPLDDQSELD